MKKIKITATHTSTMVTRPRWTSAWPLMLKASVMATCPSTNGLGITQLSRSRWLMSDTDTLLDEYRQYLDTTNIISVGGAGKVICPLCTSEHKVCRFAAGSTTCASTHCENPHHRGSR